MTRPRAALLAVFACFAAAPATATAAPLKITAKPGLTPKFSPAVTDYVSRCHPGVPLNLSIRAPQGGVRINGGSPVTGAFRTTASMRSGQGVRVQAGKATYVIRCLADDFPTWTTERHGTPQAKWYIVTPTLGPKGSRYVALFDRRGTPVWWFRGKRKPMDAKLLPNGHLAWSFFTNQKFAALSVPYEEHRLDGKLVRRIAAKGVPTDQHDLQYLPNGNRLQLSYPPRDGVDLSQYGGPASATVTDAVVQEITPKGKVVFNWSSKDHIALSEAEPFMKSIIGVPQTTPDGRTAYDIVHINSVEADGSSVVISTRQTDALYKIDKATGEIEWKIGGTRRPESLTVPGEPDGSYVFGGQHDARVLPDGTLTLHDNRTGTGLLPRALRLKLDESARTATVIEELSDPGQKPSICCGSARRMTGGNWVMSWGFNNLVTELNPAGERVLALTFPDTLFSYRAIPLMPGELTLRALRKGMDAMHPPASLPPRIRR